MRRILLTGLALMAVTLACSSPAFSSCFCMGGSVEKQFARAANIFIGQVVEVSGPREVAHGSGAQKLYVTRLFVRDRWKGNNAFDVEILTELRDSCTAYPQMSIDETYLVFADPIAVKGASSKTQGLVTTCGLTALLVGSGPNPVVGLNALATIFELDKLIGRELPKRTPAFDFKPIDRNFCLFC